MPYPFAQVGRASRALDTVKSAVEVSQEDQISNIGRRGEEGKTRKERRGEETDFAVVRGGLGGGCCIELSEGAELDGVKHQTLCVREDEP